MAFNLFQKITQDRQGRMFSAMVLLTLFNIVLVLYRFKLNHFHYTISHDLDGLKTARWMTATFCFLIWNLFLAWLPYLAALRFSAISKSGAGWFRLSIFFVVWLAFFPNAPYIVTDFVHLESRPPVPFWYDLVLLFSAAFTGLMLGLFSLFEMQTALKKWISPKMAFLFTLPALLLCGFGVWLGRFQRFNSWDLVSNPIGLFHDLLETLSHRSEAFSALKITFLLAGLMMFGYLVLLAMMGSDSRRAK